MPINFRMSKEEVAKLKAANKAIMQIRKPTLLEITPFIERDRTNPDRERITTPKVIAKKKKTKKKTA